MSETKRQEQYEGAVVAVGNSRGVRLPAGFFRAHPEFTGKVQLTVVADGSVLVSAKPPAARKAERDESDPVLASFLLFVEGQMTLAPEHIVPVDAEQMQRIGKLVEGVVLE